MRIGVIGTGFVGHAVATAFSEEFQVYTFDIKHGFRTYLHGKIVHKADAFDNYQNCIETLRGALEQGGRDSIIFVAVPTPMLQTGECDAHYVGNVLAMLNLVYENAGYKPVVVVKSTIPPMYIEDAASIFHNLSIVFNPEFLKERSSVEDFKKSDPIFISNDDSSACAIVEKAYRQVFPYHRVFHGSANELCAMKYFLNNFFTMKVAFCNMYKQYCDKIGIDYDNLAALAKTDNRIGKTHMDVPGPDGKLGFGGTCVYPETPIATIDGWKYAKNIFIGDKICDIENDTTVDLTGVRLIDEGLELDVRGRKLRGSKDHIHLVLNEDGDIVEKLLSNISLDDWILIPKRKRPAPKDIINVGKPMKYSKSWHNTYKWTKDLAWIVGLYLADGFKNNYPRSDNRNGFLACWSLGKKKEKCKDRLLSILDNMNIPYDCKWVESEGTYGPSNVWRIRVRQSWFYHLLDALKVGNNSHEKRMPLSCPYYEELIGGWLDGDGSYSGTTLSGYSENIELIYDIDTALLSLGICSTISKDGKEIQISTKNEVQKMCEWCTRHHFDNAKYKRASNNASPCCKPHKYGFACKVKSIANLGPSSVISLETESNRYIANGQLTHNCFPKDLAAMMYEMDSLGVSTDVLYGAKLLNQEVRPGEFDVS